MAQNGAYRNIGGVQYPLKPRDYSVQLVHTGVAGTTAFGFIQIDPSSPFILKSLFCEDTADPTTAAPGLEGQYREPGADPGQLEQLYMAEHLHAAGEHRRHPELALPPAG